MEVAQRGLEAGPRWGLRRGPVGFRGGAPVGSEGEAVNMTLWKECINASSTETFDNIL